MFRLSPCVAVLLLLGSCATPQGTIEPYAPRPVFARVHSHNDYRRERPLLDALDARVVSIEADVFLVGGDLLVAHDRHECTPERTLRGMYLEPLAARARAGGGRVYADAEAPLPPLILLVDLKRDGERAYRALDVMLAASPDVWTSVENGVVTPRAVSVVISGDIPRATIVGQTSRRAFVDGRGPDLETPIGASAPTSLVPMVSLSWPERFGWIGLGPLPTAERERLRRLVSAARDRGYALRFWGTPNLPQFWAELVLEGVPLIGVDDLKSASEQGEAWSRIAHGEG
jgi:hypothetical protein